MSSAPRLLHLQKGGQLVNVSLMSCHSLFCSQWKRRDKTGRKWVCQISQSIKMLTNWPCLQEWELAGCISMLEELKKGKRRKGSPSLLPGSADAFARLSGRHNQTLGEKKIWTQAHSKKKKKLCLVSVRARRHLFLYTWLGWKNSFMWVEVTIFSWSEIIHLRLLVCRCALPVS